MSASVSDSLSTATGVLARLRSLVRDFDRDANGCRLRIRVLVETEREGFYAAALEILRQPGDSRGAQYLVTTLLSYNLLMRALCDVALPRERALILARAAMRVDPMTDVALARQLAEGAADTNHPLTPDDAGRVMDILAEISTGTRILPSLMRLLRNSSPYLRSKAVKLVGKGSGSVKWVRSRLEESDPRVRANAVESLWGVDTEEARELLQIAARDGNNRVAGNALIALYRLGECSIVPDLLKMADHDSALFRATAAWVMGESGDSRFSETLARLLREPNTGVRARAMSALGKIKNTMAQIRQAPQWRSSALVADWDPDRAARRLHLSVVGEDGENPGILPTRILVTEDGKPVTNYRVVERAAPEAMSLIYLFPRLSFSPGAPFIRGALEARNWKRNSDLWAVLFYQSPESEAAGEPGIIDCPPPYTCNLNGIAAALSQSPRRSDCADLWSSIWRAVRAETAPARGRRHLILFSDSPVPNWAGHGLVATAAASRATIQVISTCRNGPLEDFCRRVKGIFQIVDTPEAVAEAVSMAHLNLLARFEISYQSVCPQPKSIKIRVNSLTGWSEANLMPPQPPSAAGSSPAR